MGLRGIFCMCAGLWHIILSSFGFSVSLFFFFFVRLSEYLGRSEGWTWLLGMFSAALSALGIYFCQSCAQALSCLFWVKHEFHNSLERRQLDKGNRRTSDHLDGEQQADRKQEREMRKERAVYKELKNRKIIRTRTMKYRKTAQCLYKRQTGLKSLAMESRRVMLCFTGAAKTM